MPSMSLNSLLAFHNCGAMLSLLKSIQESGRKSKLSKGEPAPVLSTVPKVSKAFGTASLKTMAQCVASQIVGSTSCWPSSRPIVKTELPFWDDNRAHASEIPFCMFSWLKFCPNQCDPTLLFMGKVDVLLFDMSGTPPKWAVRGSESYIPTILGM